MRIWTEAAKAAQREAIKRWQPWTKSTGPKTIDGKRNASSNARKSGQASILATRTLRAALQAQSRSRRAFEAFAFWQREEKSEKRTIMIVYLRSVFAACHQAFLQGLLEWQRLDEEEERESWPIMTPEMKIAV